MLCWVLWQRQSNMEWFVRWLDGFESMCVALGYERCYSSVQTITILYPLLFPSNTTHTRYTSAINHRDSLWVQIKSTCYCWLLFSSRISEGGAVEKPVQQGVELQWSKEAYCNREREEGEDEWSQCTEWFIVKRRWRRWMKTLPHSSDHQDMRWARDDLQLKLSLCAYVGSSSRTTSDICGLERRVTESDDDDDAGAQWHKTFSYSQF